GQRQGIGVGGQRGGSGEPWFVVAKDMAANTLTVVQGHEHPLLHCGSLRAADTHWIGGEAPRLHWVYGAKTRYRQPDAPCSVSVVDAGGFTVEFAAPQFAVTPGQSVVVYESRVCLGGGIIQSQV
ncbi:MAG: tRNA 2-thiouridine(34) synthase MnmA, partial [Betaproteobacteria bacterium]|nr:tRNA 2-thiouridine(34) synthase MnmA [Betaproteobacteria bacterium]